MNGNTNSKTPYFSFFQKSYCDSEYMKSHDKIKIYLPDREIEYRIAAAVSPSGPPSWVMITFAAAALGVLILTGNCRRFS